MQEHNEIDRSKSLLGTIVRRYLRRGVSSGPIGKLIAEEQRNLIRPDEVTTPRELEGRLVDRLYRRFLLQRDPTVDLFSVFAQETRLA